MSAQVKFDRLKTYDQAMGADPSFIPDPNTIYYTSDSHQVVMNGQVYGSGSPKSMHIVLDTTFSYNMTTRTWTVTGIDDLDENETYICFTQGGAGALDIGVFILEQLKAGGIRTQYITIPGTLGPTYGIPFGYHIERTYSSAVGFWTNWSKQSGDILATPSYYGMIGLATGTPGQTPESVSAVAGRTYAVQLTSNGKAVVNVPWTDSAVQPQPIMVHIPLRDDPGDPSQCHIEISYDSARWNYVEIDPIDTLSINVNLTSSTGSDAVKEVNLRVHVRVMTGLAQDKIIVPLPSTAGLTLKNMFHTYITDPNMGVSLDPDEDMILTFTFYNTGYVVLTGSMEV